MWRKSGLLTTQFHLGNNKNVFVPEDNNKNPEKILTFVYVNR